MNIMKSLLFLGILIFIYYQCIRYYPYEIPWNYHSYFYGFVGAYLLIYYFMNYQQLFVYKMFHNIQEAHNKPLYDMNSTSYKENQIQGIKYNIALKQGWRCMHCQNPILQQDIIRHNIHYMKPLQFGGENNIDNLGLKCPQCSTFSPY